jgi:PKD repeat protein
VTFGDGAMKSGSGDPPATLDHTYNTDAAYQATLNVFASPPFTEAAAKFFTAATVTVGGGGAFIRFEPTPTSGKAPLKVSFRIDASNLPKPVVSWQILFGDGLTNQNSGTPPRFAGHTYTTPGTYKVLLVLISGGTQYISSASITVS